MPWQGHPGLPIPKHHDITLLLQVYYKEAVAALIVFDCTRQSTFDAVLTWKNDLDSKVLLPNGEPVPCLLLSNKVHTPSPHHAPLLCTTQIVVNIYTLFVRLYFYLPF